MQLVRSATTIAPRSGLAAITGPDGLLKYLTKRVVERAMSAELSDHLGYGLGEEPAPGQPNRRNGSSSKALITDHGPVPVELPRDREGSFEPQIVPKHQTRFEGFDDKILSLYARGLTTREIQGHLQQMYGVEVSPTLVSDVTDGVLEEVKDFAGAAPQFDDITLVLVRRALAAPGDDRH